MSRKKNQKRQKSRYRAAFAVIAFSLFALAAGGVWLTWRPPDNHRTSNTTNGVAATKNDSLATSTKTVPALTATNVDDPNVFFTWLTNNTDSGELLNIGTRLLEDGRAGQAILCYQRAQTLKSDDEEICFNLGVVYSRINKPAEAEHFYREALKLFPDYVEAHNNLGNVLTRQRRFGEAIDEFNAALKIAPEDASAHNNLGRALAEQGNRAEALNHFIEAVHLDTNYVEAHFNLGSAYINLGKTNEAIGAFRDTLRLRPGFEPAVRAIELLKGAVR